MYALIIFMQTISRLARIGGVPQTLLSRDIVHSISSVISVAHECLMVATPALTDAEIQQEYQSEDLGAEEMAEIRSLQKRLEAQQEYEKGQALELLELSCILMYYLSQELKAAPRMVEVSVGACHSPCQPVPFSFLPSLTQNSSFPSPVPGSVP